MKIAVIGGGASGLMAAQAAGRNAEVVLYEKNEKIGKKLYITGKGRCNVTNFCDCEEVLCNVVNGDKFLRGAVYRFSPQKTIEFFENYGVKLKVERGNRVFPLSDKSGDVLSALGRSINEAHVRTVHAAVEKVVPLSDGFCVKTTLEESRFDKIIIACGGLSYPLTGSTGDGYRFAAALGHKIVPPKAALVPLILRGDTSILQGLSLKNVTATVLVDGKSFSEFGEMLFTDKGVSGPIILTLSSLINRCDLGSAKLVVDLKPALSIETLDKRVLSDFDKYKNKCYKNSLADLMPNKLIDYFVSYTGIDPYKEVNSVTKNERKIIVHSLKNLTFDVKSTDAIESGIVTSGGVSLNEVNPKTMESKLVKGLYFAGETLDVDAFTGGFNLQIAFATGFIAGTSAGESL